MAGRICQTLSSSITASTKCRSFQFLRRNVSPCHTLTSSQRSPMAFRPTCIARRSNAEGTLPSSVVFRRKSAPDRAIRIAQRVGIPLKIAAKVDKVDEAYFRNDILPLVDGQGVEFLGEINEREKTNIFRITRLALLFPIDWPEPFGLVMIEAMACGTPVLAFRCGSVPEIVEGRRHRQSGRK